MSWDALQEQIDVRRAEFDALHSRYTALVSAVKALNAEEEEKEVMVVSTASSASITYGKCLMCDAPYSGGVTITARCGHQGVGYECAYPSVFPASEFVNPSGLCCTVSAALNDCYECRRLRLAPVKVRPAKCLMCNEPYGRPEPTDAGIRIIAKCGHIGVGSSCCQKSKGSDNWCDKPCERNYTINRCYACRQ